MLMFTKSYAVFPVPTGLNRDLNLGATAYFSVPRTHGAEPVVAKVLAVS